MRVCVRLKTFSKQRSVTVSCNVNPLRGQWLAFLKRFICAEQWDSHHNRIAGNKNNLNSLQIEEMCESLWDIFYGLCKSWTHTVFGPSCGEEVLFWLNNVQAILVLEISFNFFQYVTCIHTFAVTFFMMYVCTDNCCTADNGSLLFSLCEQWIQIAWYFPHTTFMQM